MKSPIGKLLASMRRELAEKATFRTGTVVETIDATHVLVDIGKPVPAFISPIFLPAIADGALVVVRVQGSHYDVVDAPQANARLLTNTEIAALQALLPAGNLIPNPWPDAEVPFSASFRDTIGWSYRLVGGVEWIPGVNDDDPGIGYTSCATTSNTYHPDSPYQVGAHFRATFSPYDMEVWPVLGTDISVTAGHSYSLACACMEKGLGAEQIMTLGVDWYTVEGVFLSRDLGTAPASTRDGTEDWYARSMDSDPYVLTPFPTCRPAETFTAPEWADYGRPFVQIAATDSYDLYVTAWEMTAA